MPGDLSGPVFGQRLGQRVFLGMANAITSTFVETISMRIFQVTEKWATKLFLSPKPPPP